MYSGFIFMKIVCFKHKWNKDINTVFFFNLHTQRTNQLSDFIVLLYSIHVRNIRATFVYYIVQFILFVEFILVGAHDINLIRKLSKRLISSETYEIESIILKREFVGKLVINLWVRAGHAVGWAIFDTHAPIQSVHIIIHVANVRRE